MIPAGLTIAAAGVGCAVWASVVEVDGPGWRSNLSMVLLGVGCVLVIAGVVS